MHVINSRDFIAASTATPKESTTDGQEVWSANPTWWLHRIFGTNGPHSGSRSTVAPRKLQQWATGVTTARHTLL
ncbi:hypothetical protein HPB50_005923 [Hyalomma asiaticum]|uniref:Uncharacterized protein n=1 Tax=Hyalomma asiaticum TaxID=266040 RepID=A0ACB7T3B3_HYAAI|nr:hypothetical protein HPB50_005923 [Hyalomma asiaticum]